METAGQERTFKVSFVAIVVGHGPVRDRGALSADKKVSELEWNRDLARRIYQAVNNRCRVGVVHRTVESDPPVHAVNLLKATCAIELHLNAYNGQASGTEMIYWLSSSKGQILAQTLQEAATTMLHLPNRGIKGPQAGGRGSKFLSKTNCPAVIVESFFIDNPEDLRRGELVKEALAIAYADALVKFATQ